MSEENTVPRRAKIGFWGGTAAIWFVTTYTIGWILNFSTLWNIGVVVSGVAVGGAIATWDLHEVFHGD